MPAPPDPGNPRPPALDDGVTTLIDTLLADQRRLTAVERFSQRHASPDGPALEPHYRDLIPLTAPRPGEQYAFDVDLDRCSGCKGCVTACHSLNGLDDGESWRSVGFLVGEKIEAVRITAPAHGLPATPGSALYGNRVIPLQQTVTTACHHCVEPACMLGCPVLAYDKDPLTGIVRHLDDQCIGCSYCILKCPYEVPQYSAVRGIVRKCDMCHGRLAEGEAPACVQACPNEAIQITLLRPADLLAQFRGAGRSAGPGGEPWLPDAPEPSVSIPTTRYRTRHPEATLRAADHGQPHPAPLHGPLVLMLVLTQAGLGGLLAATVLASDTTGVIAGVISFAVLNAGLAASVFHLGQPRKAWRIFLGWRTSWLSREAMVLGPVAGIAGLAVLWMLLRSVPMPPAVVAITGFLHSWMDAIPGGVVSGVLLAASLAALFAQTMVYADTGRACWAARWTAPRFLGTTLLAALATAWVLRPDGMSGALLAGATLLKLAFEISVLKHGDSDASHWTALRRTAVLQRGPLRGLLCLRGLLGVAGGVVLPFVVGVGAAASAWAVACIPLLLLGELAERSLFFKSAAPDSMPGLPG